MEIKEIVNRPNGSTFHEEEMKFVVHEYIKEKKGVNVDINLTKGCPTINGNLIGMIYSQQVNLLIDAFGYAQSHFILKSSALK